MVKEGCIIFFCFIFLGGQEEPPGISVTADPEHDNGLDTESSISELGEC